MIQQLIDFLRAHARAVGTAAVLAILIGFTGGVMIGHLGDIQKQPGPIESNEPGGRPGVGPAPYDEPIQPVRPNPQPKPPKDEDEKEKEDARSTRPTLPPETPQPTRPTVEPTKVTVSPDD